MVCVHFLKKYLAFILTVHFLPTFTIFFHFSYVQGKAQKCKFRIHSEELTGSLIQIHKNFNMRNLHAWAKQLSPGWLAGKNPHPFQDRVPFYREVDSKTIQWIVSRPPERTMNSWINRKHQAVITLHTFINLLPGGISIFWVVSQALGYRESESPASQIPLLPEPGCISSEFPYS